MFTEEDYRKYFTQIKKIEENMGSHFADYAARVDDPAVKKFFSEMSRQESAHSRVADTLLAILSDKGLKR